jgi:hypothetical protein
MSAFSHKTGDNSVTGDFSKLENLVKNLGKKFYTDIGILGAGGKTAKGGITLAGMGAVHEFGTDKAGRGNKTKIPERSFIRDPLETGQGDIEKQIEPRIQELLENGDIKRIFELIGIAGEARIQEAFETGGFGTWEDITEATKKAKGSDAILIDIGALRQAITSRVGGG